VEAEFRELDKDDAESLIALRLSVMKTNPYSFTISENEEKRTTKENIQRAIDSYASSSEKIMIGAFNGSLIGAIGIERSYHEYERHKAMLWGPYVQEPNRGKGIGNSLVKKALDFAFTIGDVNMVTVETASKSSEAIHLFKKNGFTESGRQNNALLINGDYLDLLYMQHRKSI